MYARLLFICIVAIAASKAASGQSPRNVSLKLIPEAASETDNLRLLPADPELKNGNAAVVMLRMIWEQQHYMQQFMPQISELIDLPYDDPKIIEFPFGHFVSQLRRAAYMRDADWYYPINEVPMAMILLPDVQGLRQFVGRGMSLWVGQQIAKKDLESARHGILIQLACSRHIARTPLIINQLAASANADMALDKVELLVQQPKSANLYWALAKLPDSLGDHPALLQQNSRLIAGSLPSLSPQFPPPGDADWKQVAVEFSQVMALQMPKPMPPVEAAALQMRLQEIAKQDLTETARFSDEELTKMSGEEIVMRWMLALTDRINIEIENAYSLAPPLALKKLITLQESIAELLRNIQAPTAPPFLEKPADIYLSFHKFDRRVKLLQTLESIRDHAKTHEGHLPEALSALELPAPNDPLTVQPFEYGIKDGKATLRMATIEGIALEAQRPTVYEIRIAEQ